MHNRSLSNDLLKSRRSEIMKSPLSGFKFPMMSAVRCEILNRRVYTAQFKRTSELQHSSSPVRNIEVLVSRCETELKNIRGISVNIKTTSRKLHHNQQIINKFINRPLYSIKLLTRDRPRFLNRYLKYQ